MESYYLYFVTVLSLASSIIAWYVKLRWSVEFKEAKEAQLAAKDAQIATLTEKVDFYHGLTPKKIKEYYAETSEALMEIVGDLEQQLKISNLEGQRLLDNLNAIQQDKTHTEIQLQLANSLLKINEERVASLEEHVDKVYVLVEQMNAHNESMQKILSDHMQDPKQLTSGE